MLWVKVAPSLTCARMPSYSERIPINRSSSVFPFDRVENPALMLENPLLPPDSRGCEVPESSD